MPDTLEAPPAIAPSKPASNPNPTSLTPSKPSSVPRGKFTDALRAEATPDPTWKDEPKAEAHSPETDPKPKPSDKPELERTADKPADEPAKPADTTPAKPAEKGGKKWNPVEEVKQLRPKVAQLEAKINEYEANRVPDQERTTLTQRMEQITKRNQELENLVRFKDYEQSSDYQTKYLQPYQQSMASALALISKIPVLDPVSGQQRAGNEQDIFALAALDPVALQDKAEELFGKLAPRVIGMVDKVSENIASCRNALDAEKKNGSVREQQQREAESTYVKQLTAEIDTLFKKSSEEILAKDPGLKDFLSPVEIPEGQQGTPEEIEHNEAVAKGFAFADKAFRLADEFRKKHGQGTPEEKAEVAKHLAALRNRAAGFGPLRKKYARLQSKVKELETALAGYKTSEPGAGGSEPASRANGNGGRVDFKSNLRKTLNSVAGIRR